MRGGGNLPPCKQHLIQNNLEINRNLNGTYVIHVSGTTFFLTYSVHLVIGNEDNLVRKTVILFITLASKVVMSGTKGSVLYTTLVPWKNLQYIRNITLIIMFVISFLSLQLL